MKGLLDKMAAILRRDLLSALRYRNGFLLTAFASVAELASFYFLARAIGPGFRPEGVEYFPFLLVGTGFYTFLVMGVYSFLLFRAPLGNPNLLGCALVFLLSAAIAVALGVFAAALQLAIQKGSALLWLFGSGTWFLTGTLFPVETLPKPLHSLADLIPVTHSLNGMRLALLQGANFAALRSEILYLAIFALLILPVILLVLSHTLRRARLEGTLSFY